MNSRKQQLEAFNRLLDIMDELREKCPWDKKQTLESLRHLTIEETYELADAILENDLHEIKNELGDVLLHLVFYAKIGAEKKAFDIGDVANAISEKLIARHPHIYGDTVVKNEEEVKQNWEKLKLKEGKNSVLEGVPKSLPALVKATRIQDKVSGVGFDWEEPHQVWDKVQEELSELVKQSLHGLSCPGVSLARIHKSHTPVWGLAPHILLQLVQHSGPQGEFVTFSVLWCFHHDDHPVRDELTTVLSLKADLHINLS